MLVKIFCFSDFLYLAQQEEYDIKNYLSLLPRFFFRRGFQKRGNLVLTQRVRVMYAITALLVCAPLLADSWYALPLFLPLFLLGIPLLIIPGILLTAPYYGFLKKLKIRAARKRINHAKTTVIVIAGSYGKTTVKQFIYQILSVFYKTQMVPGNINSAIGIAQWILGYHQQQAQFLIAEIDGYALGRISRGVSMLQPHYCILTNIGDQHLSRFGSQKNLARSLAELFTSAPAASMKITTSNTASKLRSLGLYQESLHGSLHYPETIPLAESLGALSDSQLQCLSFATTLATHLGISQSNQIALCKKLQVPERRQALTTWHGYDTIDDSYNISFTTACAALRRAHALAQEKKRTAVVITAGIPELLDAQQNRIFGEEISGYASSVIVLRSIYANTVIAGLSSNTTSYLADDMKSAVTQLQQIGSAKELLVLLFPELTDVSY